MLGIALAGGGVWWLQSRAQTQTQITGSSGSAFANGSAGKAAAGAPTAPRVAGVEVAKVQAVSLRDDAQAVGSLRARQSVMLRPELVGRITALNFLRRWAGAQRPSSGAV